MDLQIKEGYIKGKIIKYVEFDKKTKIIKLFAQKEGETRKSLEDFCKEHKGAIAVNGGLFVLSNPKTEYIDGIYTNGLKKEGNKKQLVLVSSQNGDIWPDYETNLKDISFINWVRSCSHYIFLYNNEIGYFNSSFVKTTHNIPDIYSKPNNRTMIGTNGHKIILACSVDKITGPEQGEFLKNLGYDIGINFDGNGSTQMYDGIKKEYVIRGDGRKITDAFIIWNSNPVPPTGDTSSTTNFKMDLTASSARLRTQEIYGSVKTTVPKGQSIKIIGLYGWTAGDGYRWAWGKYNGVDGAFQYDPAVMMPVGRPIIGEYKMKLHGSAARLRSSIRGSILKTVPNYNDIQIIEFINGKQSDGYQWCYGEHNGTKGYFQYDPKVMYPTND